jgi:hypothetical protein
MLFCFVLGIFWSWGNVNSFEKRLMGLGFCMLVYAYVLPWVMTWDLNLAQALFYLCITLGCGYYLEPYTPHGYRYAFLVLLLTQAWTIINLIINVKY